MPLTPPLSSRRAVRRAVPAGALALLVVLAVAACRSGEGVRSGALPLEAPAAPEVRLDAAEAADRARAIRDTADVTLHDGLTLRLWASEALLADPIGLAIDDAGRAYVTRTQRQKHSEFDIRGYEHWMIPSISWATVEDRRAFLRSTFAPERSEENTWLADLNEDGSHDWRDLAVEREQIYRVEDTDGDGVADRSRLVVESFDDEVTDVLGTVLPVGDDLYAGVAPDLWRLQDANGDGIPDSKTSLSHGYAVHIGFSGHGMSGLTRGPDGRIYWSIGDIGFHVEDADGTVHAYPNEGAIFRSELDGSGFEVFAAGLRNTHEFVFDDWGNLISVDNDGDHAGEHERLVYVVEGSDSGWRANWQYGKYVDDANNDYKVWMDEGYFRPRFDGQAAFLTPPVAAYHSGPAGMAYNPGTALGPDLPGRFFVAEFVGSPARSRIHAFSLAPDGAGFRLDDDREIARGILATGLDFGPDGTLYVADWIEGWDTNDQGRIWALDVGAAAADARRAETKTLLAESFSARTDADLAALLGHADQRVRMKAQFALADRGAAEALEAALSAGEPLARAHAVWGVGQLARRDASAAAPLRPLLADADAEIRAQAAKTLGDVRDAASADALVALLGDDAPRVRFFAAEALGRLAHRPAFDGLVALLADNADADVYLRHAGALALARIGDRDALVGLADHASPAVRLAAVVALRRLAEPRLARFLEDEDPEVVTEAARAINDDGGIEAAYPALARLLENPAYSDEPLVRRAVNANLRIGGEAGARRLATYAAGDAPEALRVEALGALAVWPEPSILDRVDGYHQGTLAHDVAVARAAFDRVMEDVLADAAPAVRLAAASAVGRIAHAPAFPALARLLDDDPAAEVRVGALAALHEGGYPGIAAAVEAGLEDGDRAVREAALALVPAIDLPDDRAAALLASVVEERPAGEQQQALRTLGALGTEPAREVLERLFDRLEEGALAPSIQLDVIEAVDAGGGDDLRMRLTRWRDSRPDSLTAAPDEIVAAYAETLYGGDPDRGREVVYRHPAGQCIRCHVVDDWGGDVGPALRGIGGELTREQLLESLVAPGARIAPGYGTVSGMPPMGAILDRREIRDVVAFLATLKEE